MDITIHLSDPNKKKLAQKAAAEGFSDVAMYVQDLVKKNLEDDSKTAIQKKQFEQLTEQWRQDCKYSSFSDQVARHPAYRKIVAMGNVALPFVFAELTSKPAHWFPALCEITGADPVPDKSRGKVKGMAAVWVQWGRENGYVCV